MTLDPRWIDDYMRQLNHKIHMETIRETGARALLEIEQSSAALRRAQEGLSAACVRYRYRMAEVVHQVPVTVALDFLNLLHDQQAIVIPDDQPHLALWRADIEADAARLDVAISWVPACAGINAYAWVELKRIEIAPLTSAGLYATAKHELGHMAQPCVETHRRVTTTGKQTCCVECELAAWRWAIAHSQPTWSKRMHDRMRRSLVTYRSYGTPAEQSEIDDLVSELGFYRARLARVSDGSR